MGTITVTITRRCTVLVTIHPCAVLPVIVTITPIQGADIPIAGNSITSHGQHPHRRHQPQGVGGQPNSASCLSRCSSRQMELCPNQSLSQGQPGA